MSISRQYELLAAEGKIETLAAALVELRAKVRPLHGCTNVEIYQDDAKRSIFFFIEHWASRDLQAEGGKALGKSAFQAVFECLASPPVGRFLQAL